MDCFGGKKPDAPFQILTCDFIASPSGPNHSICKRFTPGLTASIVQNNITPDVPPAVGLSFSAALNLYIPQAAGDLDKETLHLTDYNISESIETLGIVS